MSTSDKHHFTRFSPWSEAHQSMVDGVPYSTGCAVPVDDEAVIATVYDEMLGPYENCVSPIPTGQWLDSTPGGPLSFLFSDLLTPRAPEDIRAFAKEKHLKAEFVRIGCCGDLYDDSTDCPTPSNQFYVLHLKPSRITTHGCGPSIETACHEALLSAVHYLATIQPWHPSSV